MQDSDRSRKSTPPASGEVIRQERSLQTREQLMDAARKIFVRDGFERARLEEISSIAGKTRGAFYSHFKDKEDVFFAIFEQDLARDQKTFRSHLERATNKEERIEAMTSFLAGLLKDTKRLRLNLEFKMYALRHSGKQNRLADALTTLYQRLMPEDIEVILPEYRRDPKERRTQKAQFNALLDGLALNLLFDPEAMDCNTVTLLLRAGVTAILS